MTRKAAKPAGNLRFPAFITLAPSVTVCARCAAKPVVYAVVIDGLERHLDPLPLSTAGLAAAVAGRRWVAVMRPYGPPMAGKANPGHWWVTGIAGTGHRPILLAEHQHDVAPLPADAELAAALLPRFLPEPPPAPAGDDAPPF